MSLHGRAVGSILYMSCALTAGDKLDAEKQVYRRKLHSFYEVQEEIGRYCFLTCSTIPSPSQDPLSTVPTMGSLSPPSPPRGVFGFVKRVQHKGNKMSCAAKFIPLRSKTRAQAYHERDILATLGHPLVTGLLDQFETRKTLILILELYPAPEPLREFKGHRVPD